MGVTTGAMLKVLYTGLLPYRFVLSYALRDHSMHVVLAASRQNGSGCAKAVDICHRWEHSLEAQVLRLEEMRVMRGREEHLTRAGANTVS